MHGELLKIVESETQRHRMLTLCSAAAARGATFDKALLFRMRALLEEQTAIRSNILQAHRVAARNTTLTSSPVCPHLC